MAEGRAGLDLAASERTAIVQVHDQALDRVLEIRERCADRLKRSGDRGIAGRSFQAMFEMPE